MTDSELRALVRDAVGRHFAGGAGPGGVAPPERRTSHVDVHTSDMDRRASGEAHVSHAMYLTLVNVGDACLIEPAVTCNHCGYCKSHGH